MNKLTRFAKFLGFKMLPIIETPKCSYCERQATQELNLGFFLLSKRRFLCEKHRILFLTKLDEVKK